MTMICSNAMDKKLQESYKNVRSSRLKIRQKGMICTRFLEIFVKMVALSVYRNLLGCEKISPKVIPPIFMQ